MYQDHGSLYAADDDQDDESWYALLMITVDGVHQHPDQEGGEATSTSVL